MSSIGDVKTRMAEAAKSSEAAQQALAAAGKSVADAIVEVNRAAGGSGHGKVVSAIEAYKLAIADLENSVRSLRDSQASADEYVAGLG